jgi:hypothetical protein
MVGIAGASAMAVAVAVAANEEMPSGPDLQEQ